MTKLFRKTSHFLNKILSICILVNLAKAADLRGLLLSPVKLCSCSRSQISHRGSIDRIVYPLIDTIFLHITAVSRSVLHDLVYTE